MEVGCYHVFGRPQKPQKQKWCIALTWISIRSVSRGSNLSWRWMGARRAFPSRAAPTLVVDVRGILADRPNGDRLATAPMLLCCSMIGVWMKDAGAGGKRAKPAEPV